MRGVLEVNLVFFQKLSKYELIMILTVKVDLGKSNNADRTKTRTNSVAPLVMCFADIIDIHISIISLLYEET